MLKGVEPAPGFNRRAAMAAALACAIPVIGILVNPPAIQAQSQPAATDRPRFDAVSLTRNDSGELPSSGSPIRDKVGRYNAKNVSLKTLITWFYGVGESQIVGGPRWLGIDRYDISAEVEGQPSRQQVSEMLKTLLADRFRLQMHEESRQLPRYVLAAPKNGLKFGVHLAKAEGRDCSAIPPGSPGCRAFVPGPQSVTMENVTFAVLAGTLSSITGQVVTDETGLDGRYDIKVDLPPSGSTPAVSFGDALMDALQDQTGVRLESRKVPTRVFVIDRAERPTAN